MGSRINYTMIGLFVVLLAIAMAGIGLFLSNSHNHEQYNTYAVYVNEAVSGLSVQAPVKYNGVAVGYVSAIKLSPQNLQQVYLELKIRQDVPITNSTVATLMAQGVTGITYVELKSTKPHSPLLVTSNKKPYPVIKSQPSLLMQVDTAVREVSDNIKDMSHVFKKTFDDQNQQAFKQTLLNMQKFTHTLADNDEHIDTILKNLSQSSNQLPKTIHQLNKTLDSTDKMTKSITITGKNINGMVDESRATMQNLANETVPEFNMTLRKLHRLISNLQALTNELKQNPSMLVRGKQLPAPGPGERP